MIQLRSGAVTGPGRVRQVNQDRFLADDDRLFVVADGMGGHRGGEVAAQLTIDALTATTVVQTSEDLRSAIAAANRSVFHHAAEDPELSGMGTTVTAVALLPTTGEPLLSVANVGDSRTYRLTTSGFEQLTEDHSVVGELLRDGRITPEEALSHRHRSVITRALGVEMSVDVDIIEVIPNHGDRFLLCSDGLHGEVTDSAIASILRRFADPTEACQELLAAAMAKGGRDNITAVVVDVIDDADPAFAASHALGPVEVAHRDAATTTTTATPSVSRPLTNPTDTSGRPVGKRRPRTGRSSGRVRKPSPVNLRVVLFLGVVAGLIAIVMWVWRNAPASDLVPATTVPAVSSTVAGTGSGSGSGSTAPGSETTIKPRAAPALIVTDTMSGPPTTDPFADPPTTPSTTPSTTTKSR